MLSRPFMGRLSHEVLSEMWKNHNSTSHTYKPVSELRINFSIEEHKNVFNVSYMC